MHRPIRLLIVAALVMTSLTFSTGEAEAQPNWDVFDAQDQVWGCSPEVPLPPNHCVNLRSQGDTGVLMVFEPDPRGPSEGISGPQADDRPCPSDPDADDDGTWWNPEGTSIWVCHRRP